jgi:dTDP-4-amino-4,6-dideoxygalactose transaminase
MSKRFILEIRASTIIYNLLQTIEKNKKFLLPSNVCPILPLVFYKAKYNFEFVDISPKTLCMDENLAIAKLTTFPDDYAGIIFVRTYGVLGSFEEFFKKIKEINPQIIIVDDKCLAPPDFKKPKKTYSDMVLFSTGYGKYADIGFGGFCYLKRWFNYNSIKLNFNKMDLEDISQKYKSTIAEKRNFIYSDSEWLDTSDPKIAWAEYNKKVSVKLTTIKKTKNKINKIYSENLPKEIQLPQKFQNWRFNILVPNKEEILKKIFTESLFASSHYSSLDGIFSNGYSPVAENISNHIINLFNDEYFSETKALKVAKIINSLLFKFK